MGVWLLGAPRRRRTSHAHHSSVCLGATCGVHSASRPPCMAGGRSQARPGPSRRDPTAFPGAGHPAHRSGFPDRRATRRAVREYGPLPQAAVQRRAAHPGPGRSDTAEIGAAADSKPAWAGKPIWVDLSSGDPEGSRAFYARHFGWHVEVNPDPQYGGYALATIGGQRVAGIGPPSRRGAHRPDPCS